MSSDVNSIFGVIMMCYVDSLILTNHLVGDVDTGEGCVCQGSGERDICGNLYFQLSFAMNLKLL